MMALSPTSASAGENFKNTHTTFCDEDCSAYILFEYLLLLILQVDIRYNTFCYASHLLQSENSW